MGLGFADTATKEITLVDQTTVFEITDREWSPDSKWIAYVVPQIEGSNVRNDYGRLRLYSLDEKAAHNATDAWYDVNNVSFSDDGKFLTLASSRDFTPSYGNL